MEEAPYEIASLRSFSRLNLTQIRRLQLRKNICRDGIQHEFASQMALPTAMAVTVLPTTRVGCVNW